MRKLISAKSATIVGKKSGRQLDNAESSNSDSESETNKGPLKTIVRTAVVNSGRHSTIESKKSTNRVARGTVETDNEVDSDTESSLSNTSTKADNQKSDVKISDTNLKNSTMSLNPLPTKERSLEIKPTNVFNKQQNNSEYFKQGPKDETSKLPHHGEVAVTSNYKNNCRTKESHDNLSEHKNSKTDTIHQQCLMQKTSSEIIKVDNEGEEEHKIENKFEE